MTASCTCIIKYISPLYKNDEPYNIMQLFYIKMFINFQLYLAIPGMSHAFLRFVCQFAMLVQD